MASGPEIAARAAAAAAANATKAVETVAARHDNNVSETAIHDVKPEIREEIKEAIQKTPELQVILNTERHWWQKRSSWAAIGSGLACFTSVAAAIIEYMTKHTNEDGTLTVSMLGIGFAAWGGYSAWRAGRALTPLGSKPTKLPFPFNKG